MKMIGKKSIAFAEGLIQYIDNSPTPFHAVQITASTLKQAGFEELKESDLWQLQKGGAYFTIREDSTIAAWVVGKTSPEDYGFRMIGAHTDSPNLRVKPYPNVQQYGYQQVGVEVYGGVLLSSWMDRDLSLAGRVSVANGGKQKLETHFIRLDQPLLRIPLLAIHLNRDVNTKGLILNKQTQLAPIMELESKKKDPIREVISLELSIPPEKIINYDLSLYDTQKSDFLGSHRDFIVAPRLDNLCCCFAGLEALVATYRQRTVPRSTCVFVAFDNEEIGSQTAQGACSSFLRNTLQRIVLSLAQTPSQAYERAMASSLFLSADMAHAVHPNYPEKHDPQHFPQMNQGPVIKTNAQGRYATSGHSSAQFEMMCQRKNIPVQKFINRTDLACGSTIGPFIAGDLGVATVDLGAAMLSMHSIREMCGTHDPYYLFEAFKGAFNDPHL